MKRDEDDINLLLYYDIKLTENSSLLFKQKLEQNDGKEDEEKDIQEGEDNTSVGCRRGKG